MVSRTWARRTPQAGFRPRYRADLDSRADVMVLTAEACPKPECLMA